MAYPSGYVSSSNSSTKTCWGLELAETYADVMYAMITYIGSSTGFKHIGIINDDGGDGAQYHFNMITIANQHTSGCNVIGIQTNEAL